MFSLLLFDLTIKGEKGTTVVPYLCSDCLNIKDSDTHENDCSCCNLPFWVSQDLDRLLDFMKNYATDENFGTEIGYLKYRLDRIFSGFHKLIAHKIADKYELNRKYDVARGLDQETAYITVDYLGKQMPVVQQTITCGSPTATFSFFLLVIQVPIPNEMTRLQYPGVDWIKFYGEYSVEKAGELAMQYFCVAASDKNQNGYHTA